MNRYIVTMQSVPGFYEQYGPGDIKVWANDEEDAKEKAFRELKRGAFSDRSRSMWKVLAVKREAARC